MPILSSLEALDTAFKDKISGLVIDGKEVATLYINPEDKLVIEEFPSFVFYRVGMVRDGNRVCTDAFYDNIQFDVNGNPIQMDKRDSPIPMNVMYVVRCYYQYQVDGVSMLGHLLKEIPPRPKRPYLELNGEKYDVVLGSSNTLKAFSDNFGEIELKTDERVFAEQNIYLVEVDFDVFDRSSVKTAQEMVINTFVKGGS